MARSISEIQSDITLNEGKLKDYKTLNEKLSLLKDILNNNIKNGLNDAFVKIKNGYVDDEKNYIGFTLMDDIIGNQGIIDQQIDKISVLITDSVKSINSYTGKLASLYSERSQAYIEASLRKKWEMKSLWKYITLI